MIQIFTINLYKNIKICKSSSFSFNSVFCYDFNGVIIFVYVIVKVGHNKYSSNGLCVL